MKKDLVAVKSIKKGVDYKPIEDIQATEGETFGAILNNINLKIKALGHDLDSLSKLDVKILDTIEHLEDKINSVENDLTRIKLSQKEIIDKVNKQRSNKMSEVLSHFKVDLVLNLLHPSVKEEFDSNNTGGTRLQEIQKWYDELGTNAHTKKPKEIELYEFIGGVNSGKA